MALINIKGLGCLDNKTKNIIDKVEFSEDGFQLAWDTLMSRFDIKRDIVDTHLRAFFNLKSIRAESPLDLQNLLDEFQIHITALKNTGEELSDIVIIHTVKSKLDMETLKLWEYESKCNDTPTWLQLSEFLQRRIRVLETLQMKYTQNKNLTKPFSSNHSNQPIKAFVTSSTSKGPYCRICKKDHWINTCAEFLKLTPKQRFDKIKEFRLCINCFKGSHKVFECNTQGCSICHKKHHKLLHLDSHQQLTNVSSSSDNSSTQPNSSKEPEATNAHSTVCNTTILQSIQVMLPTAQLLISDTFGKFHLVRALLDCASMSNFITEELAKKLGIKREKSRYSVDVLNKSKVSINSKIHSVLKSCTSLYTNTLEFLVIPEIADKLPTNPIDISNWHIPSDIALADDKFYEPASIDILLGGEIFFKIMKNDSIDLGTNLPDLRDTEFGWIVGGKVEKNFNFFLSSNYNNHDSQLDDDIQKFWECESFENKTNMSLDEKQCENNFNNTHSRDKNGRYVVELPFKDSVSLLGDSRNIAMKRFEYLESKFEKNELLKNHYINFMREYEALGHMKLYSDTNKSHSNAEYFLPHHAVLKPDSSTTKLRVVFDASAVTTSNVSLNDVLLVGPVVQRELFSIVLRFRTFKYAFTTDIEKMYRQINVYDYHAPFQKILWREDKSQPIKVYELQTVTYGMSPAPYLATRALKQLALDEMGKYPLAANTVMDCCYVDDLLAGSNTLEGALELQDQLISMLKSAGMNLRKWAANDKRLLTRFPPEHIEKLNETNASIKTLGIIWNSLDDIFQFNVNTADYNSAPTKKHVLSRIARLFDPLGLVAPVIVTAKIMMQRLWIQKINWDEELPDELKEIWIRYEKDLPMINELQLNRCVVPESIVKIDFHGFSDASQVAYGACVYIRCQDENDQVSIHLLCSKSRVAPLKTVSIPRLELNAALLLARLITKVIQSLNIEMNFTVVLWSDSSIVLSWLKMPPYKLATYVSVRISEIQTLTHKMSWRHVDSKNNSADILSRGTMPADLLHNSSWFNGPVFLRNSEETWPNKIIKETTVIPELKPETKFVFVTTTCKDIIGVDRFSCYRKLLRVTAYCLRYIHNLRCHAKHKLLKMDLRKGRTLDVVDLNDATKLLVRIVQHQTFKDDIENLHTHGIVTKNSKLLSLTPFLDNDNLIRVGGRISKSSLSFDEKHQYLLARHHITTLMVRNEHLQNMHCGIQHCLATIRRKFWIIHGKNLVKSEIHNCVLCYRAKPKVLQQLLGDLPKSRMQTIRPFHTTGVDFCGPFSIRYKNQRKFTSNKVYICLFVCFTTKAVHLEVVEDATADSFIACLKRFFSRRGRSAVICSDNGTNFVGAYNKIKEMEMVLSKSDDNIKTFCAGKGVRWNFIPPRTPHFGGIWESGIKSVKHHIKRVVGAKTMTLEFMYTLVIEIEGILNSRPISATSTDPNDIESLTPGHFLIGTAINSVLEPDVTQLPSNRLNQWKQLTQIVQNFWKRFNLEYIQTLQQRTKCKIPHENIEVNDLVLVVDEKLPSTHWLLGRVSAIYPGSDGKVRCATIKTKNGLISRGIVKLAKLPISENTE